MAGMLQFFPARGATRRGAMALALATIAASALAARAQDAQGPGLVPNGGAAEGNANAGEATAADVRSMMSDPPSYSAVRTLLARLEARGLVKHRTQDLAYVYKSVPQASKVRESAMKSLVKTFFDGSAASAATALLGLTKELSADEAAALRRAIDETKASNDGERDQ